MSNTDNSPSNKLPSNKLPSNKSSSTNSASHSAIIGSNTSIQDRLTALRSKLKTQGIYAIIVPTADPHLSEYLPEHWQLREWISGFTGSAGTVVVTQDYAGLWADSRYWIQAEVELADTGIELQKLSKDNTHIQWLAVNLPEEATVEINANMLSIDDKNKILDAFVRKKVNATLIISDTDALSDIYTDRPALPTASLYIHNPEFVSTSTREKLAKVREGMTKNGATHHLISSLDDIAWLTNLRGEDVDYNPVFLSHMIISDNTATLFIDTSKVSDDIQANLAYAGIDIANYEEVQQALAQLTSSDNLLIDPAKVAVGTLSTLDEGVTLIESIAPSTLLKSIKSASDIDNIREAMRQDGVALCQFFAELERRLSSGERVSELDVDSMLIEFRSKQANYVSPSFPTIAGFNANGAIVHYRATKDNFSYLDGDGLLLIDSGAQYQNGTTDITRVIPIGEIDKITDAQKKDFTAVLKAHIALAITCFPEGISAPLIDAICRAPLWAMQMDYGHGTGHGVGYFMNVHEGPQGIAYAAPATANRTMRAGMITSNEPGLYREGQWGIRIENLVANMTVENPMETSFGDYLYFETLTYCPIDTRLINKEMLTKQEINWLNSYHQTVFSQLSPHLTGQPLTWLTKRTKKI